MTKTIEIIVLASVAGGWLAPAAMATAGSEASAEPIKLGSQLELFVNDLLIDQIDGVSLEMQRPIEACKVIDFDQPWEGNFRFYQHVVRDGDKWRMYDLGARTTFES